VHFHVPNWEWQARSRGGELHSLARPFPTTVCSAAYNIAVYRRSLCLAFIITAFGGVATCQCPKDVVPPGVTQHQEELGARPLNVVIREVHFINMGSSSFDEQRQVADSLVGLCFPENNKNEIEERIRYGFQHFGFFKVRTSAVTVEARDSSNPPTVSVAARVEEGARYRLKGITFAHNRAVSNATVLRSLFPLTDGEIFDRESVSKGLESLRQVYAQLGYINFSAVPETDVDEENKLITLALDFDEGGQFSINSFTIKDADGQRAVTLRAMWPEMLEPGRIYNARLIKLFFEQAQRLLPPGASPERNLIMKQNSLEQTVDIVLNNEPNPN